MPILYYFCTAKTFKYYRMMKFNLKLLAILFAFLLQSSTLFAQTPDDGNEIELTLEDGKIDPTLGGNAGPSRAPGRFPRYTFSLSAYINAASQQLFFYDANGRSYTYSIVNADGAVVQEGALNFSFGDTVVVDVDFLLPGEYTLEVVQGTRRYSGTFQL